MQNVLNGGTFRLKKFEYAYTPKYFESCVNMRNYKEYIMKKLKQFFQCF